MKERSMLELLGQLASVFAQAAQTQAALDAQRASDRTRSIALLRGLARPCGSRPICFEDDPGCIECIEARGLLEAAAMLEAIDAPQSWEGSICGARAIIVIDAHPDRPEAQCVAHWIEGAPVVIEGPFFRRAQVATIFQAVHRQFLIGNEQRQSIQAEPS